MNALVVAEERLRTAARLLLAAHVPTFYHRRRLESEYATLLTEFCTSVGKNFLGVLRPNFYAGCGWSDADAACNRYEAPADPGALGEAVAAMQDFLTPKAVPKSEDKAFLAKEFLKAAQAGAQVEMAQMLTAHPSLTAARSSFSLAAM